MRVIFFNGPPGSGKDTAAKAVCGAYGGYPQKFAQPLGDAVRAFFGLGLMEYTELREARKNEPVDVLLGKSMREVMISLSEDWAKKFFDPSVFGKLAIQRLPARTRPTITVFSDCGFAAEVEEVANYVGKENCLIVQLTRFGKDYTGDSRGYITVEGVQVRHLNNVGDRGLFERRVVENLKDWVIL